LQNLQVLQEKQNQRFRGIIVCKSMTQKVPFMQGLLQVSGMRQMKIGYARVSTQDQNLELQLRALKKGWVPEDLPREGLRIQPAVTRISAHARPDPAG
jgi:hypothetical protein